MSSRPSFLSSSMTCGTSLLWPAASDETPTTWTSFSTAWRATSRGVWKSGPISTSKPKSANAVAITLEPRSWPSCPILATRRPGARVGWGRALGADIHGEDKTGERGGDHLGAAVVAVLPHLGHQQARAAALGGGKLIRHVAGLLEVFVHLAFSRVYAGNGAGDSLVAAPHAFQRRRDLAQRGAAAERVWGRYQAV